MFELEKKLMYGMLDDEDSVNIQQRKIQFGAADQDLPLGVSKIRSGGAQPKIKILKKEVKHDVHNANVSKFKKTKSSIIILNTCAPTRI